MLAHSFIVLCVILLGQTHAEKAGVGPGSDEEVIDAVMMDNSETIDPMKGKLQIDIISRPDDCPEQTKFGDELHMQYTGLLEDGTKFDSSYDRGHPFIFELGAGQVIKGWDQGLHDMCVGEKRKLVIPPKLAYGDRGAGDKIPPGATLYMEVELEAIREGSGKGQKRDPDLFKAIDGNGDGELTPEEVSKYIRESEGEDEAQKDDEHNKLVDEIFQTEDKNKDGAISYDEFTGPKHDEL